MSEHVAPANPGTFSPADPTVDQLLHTTPLAPLLDTPVSQVLAGLGLPSLPQLSPLPPMPGLPVVPAIDLSGLLTPITDLLGGFGTGNLGAADPTAFLDGISQALDLSLSMGSAALRALDGLWSGTGATANTLKSIQTTTDSADVGAQAVGIRVSTTAAAAIVGAGLAAVQAVVIRTAGLIAAAGPALVTPPGQAFAIGAAADGLAEAAAIVTATRAQLAAPTAGVAAAGAPVPVTGAPSGVGSPFAAAAAMLDGLAKPMSALVSRTLVGGAQSGVLAGRSAACPAGLDAGKRDLDTAPASTVAAGLRSGAGGSEGSRLSLGTSGSQAQMAVRTPGAALGVSSDVAAGSRGAPIGTPQQDGYLPIGAMGTARGASASEVRHQSADYLTTAPNGRDIVGEIDDAVPAVLGGDPSPVAFAPSGTHPDEQEQ